MRPLHPTRKYVHAEHFLLSVVRVLPLWLLLDRLVERTHLPMIRYVMYQFTAHEPFQTVTDPRSSVIQVKSQNTFIPGLVEPLLEV